MLSSLIITKGTEKKKISSFTKVRYSFFWIIRKFVILVALFAYPNFMVMSRKCTIPKYELMETCPLTAGGQISGRVHIDIY